MGFLRDYKKILKEAENIGSWDVFDYHEERMSAERVTEFLSHNDEESTFPNLWEYVSDESYRGAEYLLDQYGYDKDEIWDKYPEKFDEIRYRIL